MGEKIRVIKGRVRLIETYEGEEEAYSVSDE
jgi:hypothetical protein